MYIPYNSSRNFNKRGHTVNKDNRLNRGKKERITQKELQSRMFYNPVKGTFMRIKNVSNSHKAGEIIGTNHHQGHLNVMINSEIYKLHHLAWLYMTGEWPTKAIRHINGDKTDNRFFNLKYT